MCRVARAYSRCALCVACWVSANKLATPNKPFSGFAFSRHPIHLLTSAVLALICGCANKIEKISLNIIFVRKKYAKYLQV